MCGFAGAVVLLPQDDELVLVHERQRPEEDGVNHREEPDRQPEAEPQRERRGETESRSSAQAADRVPQVLAAGVGEPQAVGLPPLVPDTLAGAAQRVGGLGGHTVSWCFYPGNRSHSATGLPDHSQIT